VLLPSGRTIEVIQFDSEGDAGRRDLHTCPQCGSELVQPVAWDEQPHGHWYLELACPNCGWDASGIFDSAEVEVFEDNLDEGLRDMIEDLQRLAQSNLAGDFERFVRALDADLILPEDF
jgi:predicted RNA-binding Zn-ribbon protein involved in translation (DUF1610 family)